MAKIFRVSILSVLIMVLAVSGCKKPEIPDLPVDPAALARAEEAYQNNPDDRPTRKALVMLLLQQGGQLEKAKDLEGAIKIYRRTIWIEPGKAYAHFALGRTLTTQGKAWDALPMFEGQMRRSPKLSYEFYHQLARTYRALGRYDKASESLMKCMSLQPFKIRTYRALLEVAGLRGKQTPAEREAARTAGVEKYGVPDRGWRDRTLEEWQQVAAAPGVSPAAAGSHQPGQGSGRARKAIALYNIACCRDQAVKPEDILTFEEAVKAWQAYLKFTEGILEESVYAEIVGPRLEGLQQQRNKLIASLGVTPVDEVLTRSRKLNESLQSSPATLTKVKAAAEAAGETEAAARAQALLDQLLAANVMSAQDKLREVNHQARSLIERAQQKDATLTGEMITSEAQRLGAEVEAVRRELGSKGIGEAVFQETAKLAEQFKVNVMAHGGGEGRH